MIKLSQAKIEVCLLGFAFTALSRIGDEAREEANKSNLVTVKILLTGSSFKLVPFFITCYLLRSKSATLFEHNRACVSVQTSKCFST